MFCSYKLVYVCVFDIVYVFHIVRTIPVTIQLDAAIESDLLLVSPARFRFDPPLFADGVCVDGRRTIVTRQTAIFLYSKVSKVVGGFPCTLLVFSEAFSTTFFTFMGLRCVEAFCCFFEAFMGNSLALAWNLVTMAETLYCCRSGGFCFRRASTC